MDPATAPGSGAPVETVLALTHAYLAMTRAITGPAGDLGQEADLAWGVTPLPLNVLNRVMRPRLVERGGAPTSSTVAAQRIAGMVARFDAAGVPSTWWLDAQATPSDLDRLLGAAGFAESPVPGRVMTMDLDALPDLTLPPGVEIGFVTDRAEMAAAQTLGLVGMGTSPSDAAVLGTALAAMADDGTGVRCAVARLDGRPVASATAVQAGSIVGLYTISTLPDARRLGIGGAITLAVLHDAASRGARQAVLEASDAGHSTYRRLGFIDDGTIRVFWRRAGGPNIVDRLRRLAGR